MDFPSTDQTPHNTAGRGFGDVVLVCCFHHRDDTTDPGLQRLVVDTGGYVPDIVPVTGLLLLASFTLELLGNLGRRRV